MNEGRYLFAQIKDFIPRYEFDKLVTKYNGDFHVKDLTCYNQLLHLLFGQLTGFDSLHEICLCLDAHKGQLYHWGFRNTVTISSLSRANENRDYRIYEDLGKYLINYVGPMCSNETDDRLTSSVRADFIIRLTGVKSKKLYPAELRIVKAFDDESGELTTFVTNNFRFSPLDIANTCRHRWDIEMFFKWAKQNITIKQLWGYSENAVKTHLWVAISAYLVLAKIKAEYNSLYSIT